MPGGEETAWRGSIAREDEQPKARRPAARPEQRARLDHALEALELARIGTIHAFCANLLHERPVEAGIDPLLAVAADAEAQALIDEAFDGWFETVLGDPPEGVRRLLRRRSERVKPREQLRIAMTSLLEHRDFPAPWRRDAFDRDKRIDALVTELAELAAIGAEASSRTDSLARNLEDIDRFIADATRLGQVSGRDYDGLEAGLRDLAHRWGWRDQGRRSTTFGDMTRDEVRARRDRVRTDLDAFVAASDADLAPLLHAALQAPIAAYEHLKTGEGRLDFLDLLIEALKLIREKAAVRNELQCRYTHFFIDEFKGYRPAPGRDPAAPGGRRRGGRVANRATGAGQAVPGWRPEAVDIPVSPRRYRTLRGGEGPPRHGRCGTVAPDDQLPGPAFDPIFRQRGVFRRDGARARSQSGRLCCARTIPLRNRRSAHPRRPAGSAAV